MTNPTKFSDQELAEIRNLQAKFQEKLFEFGKFRVERMQLLKLVREIEARETKAEEEYNTLLSMEQSLLEKLTKKYGEGQLNMDDGTFIPAVPVTQKDI